MKTREQINNEIMEAVAKQRTQTADIEGMQKAQADDQKRNLLQILGDMLVKVSRLVTWILVKIFRRGELPPEPEKNHRTDPETQREMRQLGDFQPRKPSSDVEPKMKNSFNAASAEMRNAVDKVLKKVFDAKKVDKPLEAALQALGETPSNFNDWTLDVQKQKDGTFAVMSKASPSQEWKPFLEGIPTAADAAAVVAAVPRQEMDRIARAGRILKHLAEDQGQDGVRMRARFTSAATGTVLQGQDWRGDDFAEAFVPYLKGDGPKPARPQRPKEFSDDELKELNTFIELSDGMDLPEVPAIPSPPPFKRNQQAENLEQQQEPKEATWGDYKPTTSAADASIQRLLSGLDRRKVGADEREDEEDDLELELDGYGPRM